MLDVGTVAPDFDLTDQEGVNRTLSEHRGKWVVLYFYPKDDTPGCAKEACAFRDGMADLGSLDAVVYGVSADDTESHAAFSRKFSLNFPILSDVERKTIDAYEAWGEKEREGESYQGILRISYLIDPRGRIAQSWTVTDPESHAAEVKEALETQSGA